jgi:hypothetical protein
MGGKRKREDDSSNEIKKHSSKLLSATATSSSSASKGNASTKLVVSVGKFASRRFPEMEEFWRRHVISSGIFLDSSTYEDRRISDRSFFYTQATRYLKSQGGTCNSNRHLRRRTKSHTPIQRHRFPTTPPLPMDSAVVPATSNRKALRRNTFKLQSIHRGWWNNADMLNDDTREESYRSSSATNWLETHVWHAKRFYLSPPLTFGESSSGVNCNNTWCIPLAHTGRGIRSLFKRLNSEESPACTIQDHTWMHQPLLHFLITSNFEYFLQNFGRRILGLPCDNEANGGNVNFCMDTIFYELDSYPLNCIGPGRMYSCSEETSEGNRMHVFLSTHPSIRKHVETELITWIDGLSNDGNSHVRFITKGNEDILGTKNTIKLLSNPTALFSIRGLGSTKTISSTLKLKNDNSCLKEGIQQFFPFHCDHQKKLQQIPHLTMLSAIIQIKKLKNGDSKIVVSDDQDKATMKEKIHSISCLIIFVSPPAQNYRCSAISGWDIICPAFHAKTIFLALQNNALAIGLCEENAIFLESGYPQFPRDFPDTPEGKKYWAVTHDNENSWGIVRTCHEKSGRRFATYIKRARRRNLQRRAKAECFSVNEGIITEDDVEQNQSHDTQLLSNIKQQTSFISIDWNTLLSTENNAPASNHSQVVLVRGEAFGMPFRQVLSGMGLLVPYGKISSSNPVRSIKEREEVVKPYSKDDNASNNQQPKRVKHRPRRKVLPISRQAQAFPNSKLNKDDHLKLCKDLLGALSLPALLRCSLLLCGKGMINAGDYIYEFMKTKEIDKTGAICKESLLLGRVTAGYFSHSQGCVLGIGIISAKHFLSVVYRASLASTVLVPDRAGHKNSCTDRRVELRVFIKNAKNANKNQVLREAALYILL